MRVAVFYVCLYLLMLCGGHALYASARHHSSSSSPVQNPAKHKHVKLSNNDEGKTVIDDAEIDLDEEHLNGDDAGEVTANKFLAGKYSLQNRWYITCSSRAVAENYHNDFQIISSIRGESSPIYITQRVLRI